MTSSQFYFLSIILPLCHPCHGGIMEEWLRPDSNPISTTDGGHGWASYLTPVSSPISGWRGKKHTWRNLPWVNTWKWHVIAWPDKYGTSISCSSNPVVFPLEYCGYLPPVKTLSSKFTTFKTRLHCYDSDYAIISSDYVSVLLKMIEWCFVIIKTKSKTCWESAILSQSIPASYSLFSPRPIMFHASTVQKSLPAPLSGSHGFPWAAHLIRMTQPLFSTKPA